MALISDIEIPRSVGQFYVSQLANGKKEKREVELGQCSDEVKERQRAYWAPRLVKENYDELISTMKCLNDENLSIRSQQYFTNYEYVFIGFVPCFKYGEYFATEDSPTCMSYEEYKEFWKLAAATDIGVVLTTE